MMNGTLPRLFAATVGIAWGSCMLTAQAVAQPGPSTIPRNPVPSVPGPVAGPKIEFGGRVNADRLAAQLVADANSICLQLDRSYQGNSNFRERYRDMYGILQDAQQVREQVKRGAHRGTRRDDDQIATSLHKMDRDFHRIERELLGWRAQPGARNVVRLDPLLSQFESNLHEMMEDYGVRSQVAAPGRPVASPPSPPRR